VKSAIASLDTLRDGVGQRSSAATLAFYAASTGADQDGGIDLLDSVASNGYHLFRTTGAMNDSRAFGGWRAWLPDAEQIPFVEVRRCCCLASGESLHPRNVRAATAGLGSARGG
jgi:hypothetical protein